MKMVEIVILIWYFLTGLGLVIPAWTESRNELKIGERIFFSILTLLVWPVELILGFIVKKNNKK